MSQLYACKNYDNASSNNEVIATTSSAFLKFSKKILNQRWPLSAIDMFDAIHFNIEATLDITDSDKLSKHSSYFLQRRIYRVQRWKSHYYTSGVP